MSRSKKLSFDQLVKADKHLQKKVPKIIGERARRFFELSFKKQGFTDNGFSAWSRRKKETRLSTGKKVLSSTGMLANSIRRTKTTPRKVVISSVGLKYANIHNSGVGNMPKRKFIGNSKTLEKGLEKRIEHELKKIIKL